ncbi:hypothetical protein FFD33_22330 [Salmonella enterica]|nr:hypothetical protein [Salmonella enterica]EBS0658213.1 hypothetical protein [Salmonella enterica subsp. enterica serovar Kintambo]EED3683752.1 transposase [Salmonella enterica subsp. enterica]EAU3389329.1 hypothetical protein [Salmonella enterica]EAU3437725.1 hypothetical protein [Salmonella enterica]
MFTVTPRPVLNPASAVSIPHNRAQIIAVIRSVESGQTVKDVYREAGISEATRDNWKSGYGGRDTRGITKGSTVFTVCSS